MKLEELKTLENVYAFLECTNSAVFEVADTKADRYQWATLMLIRIDYINLL